MKLLVIGSGNEAHIRIDSQFVSNYHAELLLLDNGEIILTDKGSKNGTYLNEQRLQPNKDIPIKRGDNIRIADKILDWEYVPNQPMPDPSKIKEMRGIGTNFRNKYQLQGSGISRFHATYTKKSDNKWYIQDHSKNGTKVNGQRIASNQDVRIKKGDRIQCAGIEVPNPYGTGTPVNYSKIFMVIAIVLLACGTVFGIVKLVENLQNSKNNTETGRGEDSIKPEVGKDSNCVVITEKELPDEDIYKMYKNSTSLIIGYYYYRITAGGLNLHNLDLPTDVVAKDGKLKTVYSQKDMIAYTGTGFYISNDGKIATNLHIVRPWLNDDNLAKVKELYKILLANKAVEVPTLNAYLDEIKVEGVLHYVGIIPNGSYLSKANILECREFAGHNDMDKDVAVLQLDLKRLPSSDCKYININDAVVNDSEISVGSHVYTIGFPFGFGLQDLNSSKGITASAHGGSITKECTEFVFGFNAPSYHGASGSPVFNKKGQLIGIVNAGVDISQGFNTAIKVIHLKELLEKFKSK